MSTLKTFEHRVTLLKTTISSAPLPPLFGQHFLSLRGTLHLISYTHSASSLQYAVRTIVLDCKNTINHRLSIVEDDENFVVPHGDAYIPLPHRCLVSLPFGMSPHVCYHIANGETVEDVVEVCKDLLGISVPAEAVELVESPCTVITPAETHSAPTPLSPKTSSKTWLWFLVVPVLVCLLAIIFYVACQ